MNTDPQTASRTATLDSAAGTAPDDLTLRQYGEAAAATAVYSAAIDKFLAECLEVPEDFVRQDPGVSRIAALLDTLYAAVGLANEVGEALGKIKKAIRGDGPLDGVGTLSETGDSLWYLARLARHAAPDVGDRAISVAAHDNVVKLRDRANRGVLKGNGDNR